MNCTSKTVNLLNFQQMPTGVFDVQVAFNMIDRYGTGVRAIRWEAVERRICNHLRRLLGTHAAMPARGAPANAGVSIAYTFFHFILNWTKMFSPQRFLARALEGEHVQVGADAGKILPAM